eukprot:543814-Prymnesium_polylepis.1
MAAPAPAAPAALLAAACAVPYQNGALGVLNYNFDDGVELPPGIAIGGLQQRAVVQLLRGAGADATGGEKEQKKERKPNRTYADKLAE